MQYYTFSKRFSSCFLLVTVHTGSKANRRRSYHRVMSLFSRAGAQGDGAAAAGNGSGYLHSFKAGRCEYDAGTQTVTPVAERGTLFITVRSLCDMQAHVSTTQCVHMHTRGRQTT